MTSLSTDEITHIKEEITNRFNELVEASSSLNIEHYLELIDTELFSGLNSNGTTIQSKNELEKLLRPGFSMLEKIELLEFSNIKITVINETTAILVNEYKDISHLTNGQIFSSEGGGCQVWCLREDCWKLVSISSSNKNST